MLLAAAPISAQVRREYTEVHMGMPVRIVLHALDDSVARAAARAAFRHIAELENVFSDYRAFSELRRLELRAGEWVRVSNHMFDVLHHALAIARATDGAFDPTVGPLTTVWREARRRGKVPDENSIQSALQRVGWQKLRLDAENRRVLLESTGMRLDLGGIAKGYILQQALATLVQRGTPAALIEAGGDIVTGAAPPGERGWRIEAGGVDGAFAAAASALAHRALATSGAAAQYLDAGGVRYSHVIDPRTGRAMTTLWRVHVIARDGMTADALATAVGVLGADATPALSRMFEVRIHVMREW